MRCKACAHIRGRQRVGDWAVVAVDRLSCYHWLAETRNTVIGRSAAKEGVCVWEADTQGLRNSRRYVLHVYCLYGREIAAGVEVVCHGDVAQMVERSLSMREVLGSIPSFSTDRRLL